MLSFYCLKDYSASFQQQSAILTYFFISQIIRKINLKSTYTIYNLMLLNTSLYTTLSVLLLSWLCSERSTEMFRGEVHLEKAT